MEEGLKASQLSSMSMRQKFNFSDSRDGIQLEAPLLSHLDLHHG